MALPVKRKLTIIQGAMFNPGWTWKPGGAPMDFTGCSARMQVRSDYGEPILLELTTENGGILLGGPAGTLDLWIGATDTAAITWTEGVFDIEVQYTSGPDHVDRLIQGSITVSPEVTK